MRSGERAPLKDQLDGADNRSLLVAALLLTNSYLNFEKLQNSVKTEYHLAEVQHRKAT